MLNLDLILLIFIFFIDFFFINFIIQYLFD